jgi:TP901 family phage tail tape measure protein
MAALERASNQQARLQPGVARALAMSKQRMDALGGSAGRTAGLLNRAGRGAIVGSGAVRGLARSVAFASTAFLGGAGLGAALRFVVGQAGSFETELNVLQSVTRATARQMGLVSALAKRLGADIRIPGASAADAAETMTLLAKGGLSLGQSMRAARGTLQLAAAAQLSNAEAAKITVSALNAFRLRGSQATRVADLLAAAANASQGEISDMALALQQASAQAHASGLSAHQTVTALTLLAKAGIQGSDAGTSLRVMLQRFVPASKRAAELMSELGLSAFDARGRMLPLREIVRRYSDVLSELSPKQRAFVLQTIFGADATRAANIILGQGAKAYDEAARATNKAGEAARVAGARSKGWAGAVAGAQNAVETLAITVGQKLLPHLTPLLARFGRWVGGLAESESFHRKLNQRIDQTIGGVRKLTGWLGDLFRALDSVAQMAGGWGDAFRLLITGLLARRVVQLGLAIRTQLIANGLVALGVSSERAGRKVIAQMGAMGVAARGLARTIRLALISTGLGLLIVASGEAAFQVIMHWEKVKSWFQRFAHWMKELFSDLWRWIKKTALQAALIALEPFSHLPDRMGQWARDAKNAANLELAKIRVDAKWDKQGEFYGSVFAAKFVAAATPAITKALAGVTGGPGSSGDRLPSQVGVAGTMVGGIALPTAQKPTHQTAGLSGYPAVDYFGKPGTPVRAPEDGRVVMHSGKGGTSGQVYGWSLYYVGDQTGNTYFITHLAAKRAKLGRYKKGAVLGFVSAWDGGAPHVHVGINPNVGLATPGSGGDGHDHGGAGSTNSGIVDTAMDNAFGGTTKKKAKTAAQRAADAFRAAVATQKTKLADEVRKLNDHASNQLLSPSIVKQLRARAAAVETEIKKAGGKQALPAIKADIKELNKAIALGIRQTSIAKEFTAKLGEARGEVRQGLQQLLAEPVAEVTPAALAKAQQLAAKLNAQLRSGILTPAAVTSIQQKLKGLEKTITAGLQGLLSAAERSQTKFERAWGRLAARAMQAFEAETEKGLRSIEQEFTGKTPAQLALDELVRAHEQAAAALEASEARQELEEAQRSLTEALAGGDPADVTDAQQRITRAQQRLGDLEFEQRRRQLEDQAALEEQARDSERERRLDEYRRQRDEQRDALEQQLEEWRAKVLTGGTAVLDEVQAKLGPLAAAAGEVLGVGFTDAFTEGIRELRRAWQQFVDDLNKARQEVGLKPIHGGDVSPSVGGTGRFGRGIAGGSPFTPVAMAEGGIVTGPTEALVGEAGPEAVIPLDRLRDFGGGPIELTVNVFDRTLAGMSRAQLEKLARELEPEIRRILK